MDGRTGMSLGVLIAYLLTITLLWLYTPLSTFITGNPHYPQTAFVIHSVAVLGLPGVALAFIVQRNPWAKTFLIMEAILIALYWLWL